MSNGKCNWMPVQITASIWMIHWWYITICIITSAFLQVFEMPFGCFDFDYTECTLRIARMLYALLSNTRLQSIQCFPMSYSISTRIHFVNWHSVKSIAVARSFRFACISRWLFLSLSFSNISKHLKVTLEQTLHCFVFCVLFVRLQITILL